MSVPTIPVTGERIGPITSVGTILGRSGAPESAAEVSWEASGMVMLEIGTTTIDAAVSIAPNADEGCSTMVKTPPVGSVGTTLSPVGSTEPAAEGTCAMSVFDRTADTAPATEVGRIDPTAGVSWETTGAFRRPAEMSSERVAAALRVGASSTEADTLASMFMDTMGGTAGGSWTTTLGATTAMVVEGKIVGAATGNLLVGIIATGIGAACGNPPSWRVSSFDRYSHWKGFESSRVPPGDC